MSFSLRTKKILLVAAVGVAIAGYQRLQRDEPATPATSAAGLSHGDDLLATAFENQTNSLLVEGEGRVLRVLADDEQGSRHQRFILRLASGQTILIAHNIDLAPRISNLGVGHLVSFRGEYEWNEKGGVVHWTHRDPSGVHPAGWLKHDAMTYD